MSDHIIPSEQFSDLFMADTAFLDVRAEGEFAKGSFPGATNIPILTDEERHLVGKCYKEEGKDAAVALGHRLVAGETKDRRVAAWREEHCDWSFDADRFTELQAQIGDLGAPTIFMPRMNVQSLYLDKMGVEAAIFALYDWQQDVEAYFSALEQSHDRLIDVIATSPVEIINFGENVHAGTLSPELFLRYHLPACQRRCERLRAAGKFTTSHWDGDTGPLLPYARETGLDAIEAITPAPQGDVTLEQARAALGDDMFLMDGIPAVYFDDTFSEQVLEECTRRVIELFAPRLVLGISDEISSTGDLERVRLVGRIVDEYNGSLADSPI